MKYTRLVEKYLDGEMKGMELSNFERDILKNPEVAEEVERVRSLDEFSRKQFAVLASGQDLLEDPEDIAHCIEEFSVKDDLERLKIQKIDESDPDYLDFRKKVRSVSLQNYIKVTTKNKVLVPGYVIWIAAACFALLLSFSLLKIFTGNHPADMHELYARFYNPYPADLLTRSMANIPADPYAMGLDEYQNSNYGSALAWFNTVESGSIKNKAIYLLKGICLMETGNFEAAILAFVNLSGDPVLNDYGQWYTGLCYVKLKMPGKARELFTELSNREGYYKKVSDQILKNL